MNITEKQLVATPHAPQAIGPYSQAIQWQGLVFCSGQIPLDPKTQDLVTGDLVAEVRQVLRNVKNILQAAGSDMSKVLRTTIFLTDMNDFATVNEVYREFFDAPFPARVTVAVTALPKGARVEIDAIAAS